MILNYTVIMHICSMHADSTIITRTFYIGVLSEYSCVAITMAGTPPQYTKGEEFGLFCVELHVHKTGATLDPDPQLQL